LVLFFFDFYFKTKKWKIIFLVSFNVDDNQF